MADNNDRFGDNAIQQRESHYERFFGPITQQVMHSTDSKSVHVDIYTFTPTAERPFYTLITGGMSDLRQNVPETSNAAPRTEIMLYARETKGWMYNVLKGLAEMPFDCNTFLSYRHTVPNGMPMTAEPSLLTSYFLMQPYFESKGFTPMPIDGEKADILLMIPITEAERDFAVKKGSEALLTLFFEQDFDLVIDEQRQCLLHNENTPGKN